MLARSALAGATGLAAAYSAAYSIGVVISFRWLRRRLPDLNGWALVRHCLRLLVARPSRRRGLRHLLGLGLWSESKPRWCWRSGVAGVAVVLIFALLAHLLRDP